MCEKLFYDALMLTVRYDIDVIPDDIRTIMRCITKFGYDEVEKLIKIGIEN